MSFFRNLNIEWLNIFLNRLYEGKPQKFQLGRTQETLKWVDCFRIFAEIKENVVEQDHQKKRITWHPASSGYAMIKDEDEIQENLLVSEPGPPADHTDDDPSEFSEDNKSDEDNSHSVKSVPQEKKNPKLDSSLINPIFFNFKTTTVEEQEQTRKDEKKRLKVREDRAISKAQVSRGSIIDTLEKSITNQERLRLQKIEQLEQKYNAATAKRESEFSRYKTELTEAAFNAYQFQWENEAAAAEYAFDTEIGEMRKVHEEKSKSDHDALLQKRQDLEAFKEAEKQEIPAAEKLEEFARVEVEKGIAEVEKLSKELHRLREEYIEIKKDLEELLADSEGGTQRTAQKRLNELRSMVNVAETNMKESQRKVEQALEGLEDAEVLLARALRIKAQQDELLPLFCLVARNSFLPTFCGLSEFVVAVVVLMQGTFTQKFNYLFRLLDASGEGNASLSRLLQLTCCVQEALVSLRLLPFSALRADVENAITREFLSLGLDPSIDFLTEYEAKQMVVHLVSHSHLLCQALGINLQVRMQPGAVTFSGAHSAYMSTYQRSQMSAMALFSRGMISYGMCTQRIHYERVKVRPILSAERQRKVHDLACAMGRDDPLKPDYSAFFSKNTKLGSNRVVPLSHGHLANLQYLTDQVRQAAALRVQAVFRAYLDRQTAEKAARYMAFMEAKQMALKEMRSKVVKEFKKREGGKGMGKMKWDAQVRMKQAKLRAQGEAGSRADTVLAMMEEAIGAATKGIEQRFKEMAERENFVEVKFDREYVVDNPAKQPVDLKGAFQMLIRKKSQVVVGDTGGSVESKTSEPNKSDVKKEEEGSAEEKAEGMERGEIQARETSEEEFSVEGESRSLRGYIEGLHHTTVLLPVEQRRRGETELEWELRRFLCRPEMTQQSFLHRRLRLLHVLMTAYKTSEILSELPSKRLLVRFVDHLEDEVLEEELTKHFKFKSHQRDLVRLLRHLADSDFENDTLRAHLRLLQGEAEFGLIKLFEREISTFFAKTGALVDLRLQTDDRAKESDIIKDELERAGVFKEKFVKQVTEALEVLGEMQEKFNRTRLALLESSKKHWFMQQYRNSIEGRGKHSALLPIPLDLRSSWVRRMSEAMKLPEGSPEQLKAKHSEISAVCHEFIETASADAFIIINEIHQPKYLKTIPVATEEKVDGRGQKVGRGVDGEGNKFTYEAHNIEYHVCLDYDGVYNGSDEFAAKAGGNYRLGAKEYFKLQIPMFQCPLVLTLDFQGFRVLAVAKLPSQSVTFNEEGEVRRIQEEMVHGVKDRGEEYVNRSRVAQNLLRMAASRLNLAEHHCKGLRDITSSSTFASADLEVFKTDQDDFCARNFVRAFPAEVPTETPHLPETPRGHSIFWRQLRPEYVREYELSLSPDACFGIVYGTKDAEQHYAAAETATRHLVQETIPKFLHSLLRRERRFPLDSTEGMLGVDLSVEMHAAGINMRHLGLMRGMLWRPLPGMFHLHYHNQSFKTSEDLRQELSNGDKVRIDGAIYEVQETKRNKITSYKIPLSELYLGESRNGRTGMVGRVSDSFVAESEDMRLLLLAEMVARTMKALFRLQLRKYNQEFRCSSRNFCIVVVCEYLNLLTGASASVDQFYREALFDSVRERFGTLAIQPHEHRNFFNITRPLVRYMVGRFTAMLGIRLTLSCYSEFCGRSHGFLFSTADVLDIAPVRKHNVLSLPYSEAVLVSLKAKEAEKDTYTEQVMADRPVVLFTLSERKGAQFTTNKGSLGDAFEGEILRGCELEHPGPVMTEKFIRSFSFRPNAKPYVATEYHPAVVPEGMDTPFTVEVYCKCSGGENLTRAVLTSGRYSLYVTRTEDLSVVFSDGPHDISIRLQPIVYNQWLHVVITYDGTTVHGYVNGELKAFLEIADVLQSREQDKLLKMEKKREQLHLDERKEQAAVPSRVEKDAAAYFLSKEGIAAMKRRSKRIMESSEFLAENIGEQAPDRTAAVKMMRIEALARAKDKYIDELNISYMKEIVNRYVKLRQELEENLRKADHEGREKVFGPLFIGALPPDARNREGSAFFYGDISCLSVYSQFLSADRIKVHYHSSSSDRRVEARRLHIVAASKFEEALKLGSPEGDSGVLKGHAQSICSYLNSETLEAGDQGQELAKTKIVDIIERFKGMRQCDGIAEILRAVPRDPQFADVVTAGFAAIRDLDKNFFSRSLSLQREELVQMPFDFALVNVDSKREHWDIAAYLFREVVRDVSLIYVYGDIDLRWLYEVKSALLVISLVKHAQEDKELQLVQLAEMFQNAGFDPADAACDDDVMVLSHSLPMNDGFELPGCAKITDLSLTHISRLSKVKILNFDGCPLITDTGISKLSTLKETLEVLSLAGLSLLTDESLKPLVEGCHNLTLLNVSQCPLVSHKTVVAAAKSNRRLGTINISGTQLNDEGLVEICCSASSRTLTNLDISLCRDLTDAAICSIAETFLNMKHLSLRGLSRVSDQGIQAVCSRCWYLQTLNIEDVFLARDAAFWFNPSADGRSAANENMLVHMRSLNLTDCTHLTDYAVEGLAERCRNLSTLILRGCDGLTDKALLHMADPSISITSTLPLCDTLQSLTLAYSSNFTAQGILSLVPSCVCLEELDLSGLASAVTDRFVSMLAQSCPTLQKLVLQKCIALSDAGLCALADHLWLEHVDLMGCGKLSDEGVEVLVEACTGLRFLGLAKIRKLTDRAVLAVKRNCVSMKLLDVSECPGVSMEIVEEVLKGNREMRVKK